MEDKPTWPRPPVVASQQHTQWEEETPSCIHEYTMKVDVGELWLWATQACFVLTITTQLPHTILESSTTS